MGIGKVPVSVKTKLEWLICYVVIRHRKKAEAEPTTAAMGSRMIIHLRDFRVGRSIS